MHRSRYARGEANCSLLYIQVAQVTLEQEIPALRRTNKALDLSCRKYSLWKGGKQAVLSTPNETLVYYISGATK